MKPHFSDSEAWRELNARKLQRDNEWLLRQIGDATYKTSLQILGYAPRDAETELNHLRMERK